MLGLVWFFNMNCSVTQLWPQHRVWVSFASELLPRLAVISLGVMGSP